MPGPAQASDAAVLSSGAAGYGSPGMGCYGEPHGTPMAAGRALPNPTSLPLAPQELEYYQQLFSMTDAEGHGIVDGLACANFLYSSGLPQEVLHRIWDIADRNVQGFLNAEGFYVALRLVAHAQAGRMPEPDLVMVEPPALPDFPRVQRRRDASEISPAGSQCPSVNGTAAGSDLSEMQPVIAGEEEQIRRAARSAARQASRSASPTPFTRSRWAPSQREKRKYASLFKRTDWDGDGYVQGHEAQVLLERSRLPTEQLSVAWEHADRDRDGRLDFHEFVCLVHLVTCMLRGAKQPGPMEDLPIELTSALANLEPLDILAAEREASRSRSASPLQSSHESPAFPPRSPRDRGKAAGWTGFGQEPGGGDTAAASNHGFASFEVNAAGFAGFPGVAKGHEAEDGASPKSPKDSTFGFPAAPAEGFGNTNFGDFNASADGMPEKRKKDKKGRRKSANADAGSKELVAGSSAVSGFGGLDADGAFGDFNAEQDPFGTDRIPGTPGAEFGGERGPAELAQLSAAVSQFESVASADQQVSKQLRHEVDELDAELREAHDAQTQLERQVQLDQQECERLETQRQRLEGQLRQARQRFVSLQEERRSVNFETMSLRRDHQHLTEECVFLQRLATDEEGTLEVLRHANQFLERSQHDLEVQTDILERGRKDVLRMTAKEKEVVQAAERQNAHLRNKLELLRREQAAAAAERQEASLRDERVRELQSHGTEVPMTADGRPREPLPSSGKHTWAPSVLGSKGPATLRASTGNVASLGRARGAVAALATAPSRVLASREGV